MSAEGYQIISILGFVCAATFLIVAIVMFFVFDIPAVVAELSGKNAEKQVAELRERNKKAVDRRAAVGLEMPAASTVKVIGTQQTDATIVLGQEDAGDDTVVLGDINESDTKKSAVKEDKGLEMINEAMEVHTDETID